jgi:hypothetical protein
VIDSAALLADLKRQLRVLEDDLRVRAEDTTTEWGSRLRDEHRRAQSRERTGLAWIPWRDGEVSQAAVAWIIASVFIRFAEDNGLLAGAKREGQLVAQPWFAAPDEGLERAVENETAFYSANPTRTTRDWMMDAFTTLADLPAGRPVVDPDHSAIWHAPISATASDALVAFFRRTTPDGALVHDFSDTELDTRFLGDLYQDLSDYAKKTYALLQTPLFVEEFILDLTLTPAIAEFGLTGLKVIDPACGSGHFLLGTFERLVAKWSETAPGLDRGELVQRALDSVHGVDLNPFAIAIARFRLTVAALKAAGLRSLVGAPAFKHHLAIGDSLLGGATVNEGFDFGDGDYFEYAAEDLREYAGILEPGQYHVVVANPPYIIPRDPSLRARYRDIYKTCSGQYGLHVPFTELLFKLAMPGSTGLGAGFVGEILANNFMKREFGEKLIERFLSGVFTGMPHPEYVDLTHIVDTSGAYIPGHGTPTAIVVGRPRKPVLPTVRVVLGARGEPEQPAVPADGLVWREITANITSSSFEGVFVSILDEDRAKYAEFPWSLQGGGASAVLTSMDSETLLGSKTLAIGRYVHTGADDVYFAPNGAWYRRGLPTSTRRPVVEGRNIRDWDVALDTEAAFPYGTDLRPSIADRGIARQLWSYRVLLAARAELGGTPAEMGHEWYQFSRWHPERYRVDLGLAFAFVATHNHFVLDRGGKIFNRSAPVIKLPEGATEDDHYDLLGVLNSSTACFWLKQVSHDKGNGGIGGGIASESWERFFEFTGTKLAEFPLPGERARSLARRLDETSQKRAEVSPSATLAASGPSQLAEAKSRWVELGHELVALQEELDWTIYAAYGLVDPELAAEAEPLLPISANERPFEVALARSVAEGTRDTTWFSRHSRAPVTQVPSEWPTQCRELHELRMAEPLKNPLIRQLEQPEYKRRWLESTWGELVGVAVRDAILDRLEAHRLWLDGNGRPRLRSLAQLADEVRQDKALRELIVILAGSQDFDLAAELSRLVEAEAVPALAILRYKAAGVEKFRAWERTWELQRAEDRGDLVEVPVPPKYAPGDFLKTAYWTARGKLDVPKERFIAFPGSHYPEDGTAVYGWAGWDHSERGQAIARFANDVASSGAPDEQVIPLVGALIELEPWLKQWHDEIGPSGVSPAGAIASVINALLGRLGLGRDTIAAWRPAPPTRRGRSSA